MMQTDMIPKPTKDIGDLVVERCMSIKEYLAV
jgi:hypothetical protein